jgi:hypothetical protein
MADGPLAPDSAPHAVDGAPAATPAATPRRRVRHLPPSSRPARLVQGTHVTFVRERGRVDEGARVVVVVELYGTLARFDAATGAPLGGPPSAVRYRLDVAGGTPP